jgi:hypothetical protein
MGPADHPAGKKLGRFCLWVSRNSSASFPATPGSVTAPSAQERLHEEPAVAGEGLLDRQHRTGDLAGDDGRQGIRRIGDLDRAQAAGRGHDGHLQDGLGG